MKTEADEKSFDVMKWLREVRDRINEEIAEMSGGNLREWFFRRPTDPVLARLFDRRTVPDAREGGACTARERRGECAHLGDPQPKGIENEQ